MTLKESRAEVKQNVIPLQLGAVPGLNQGQKPINRIDYELAPKRDPKLNRIPLEKLVQVAELLK